MSDAASFAPSYIDHHSEDFARRQLDIYREARAQCPVLHSTAHGGFAILTRFDDVRAALRNPALSSARFVGADHKLAGGVAIPPNGMRIGMIEMDPPEATRYRDLLKGWFSIPAVEAGAPRVEQLASWVIDRVIERGACDVVADLARPMPTLLILDVLGLPFTRWQDYGKVLHEAVAKASGSFAGLKWLLTDLRNTIEMRDYRSDGLVAALARAEMDGAPLSGDMICELSMMLLFGGTDTTIAAIAHAILYLSRHPADRAALIAAPQKMAAAVEEVLRLYSPSTGVARTVTRETNVGGETFAPGTRVLCAVNSANRDEAAFKNAEQFDLTRPAKPHLAFGAGIHACLGQNLARMDLRLFLNAILARMPTFEVDEAGATPYASTPLVSGYASMPIRFTPGPVLGARTDAPVLTAPPFQPR
ncbi:MAG TPA: cytochrome P450 [Caulobacterales bacterium]|nr:cytochrome P450 [Caulobacterales bacterium]